MIPAILIASQAMHTLATQTANYGYQAYQPMQKLYPQQQQGGAYSQQSPYPQQQAGAYRQQVRGSGAQGLYPVQEYTYGGGSGAGYGYGAGTPVQSLDSLESNLAVPYQPSLGTLPQLGQQPQFEGLQALDFSQQGPQFQDLPPMGGGPGGGHGGKHSGKRGGKHGKHRESQQTPARVVEHYPVYHANTNIHQTQHDVINKHQYHHMYKTEDKYVQEPGQHYREPVQNVNHYTAPEMSATTALDVSRGSGYQQTMPYQQEPQVVVLGGYSTAGSDTSSAGLQQALMQQTGGYQTSYGY